MSDLGSTPPPEGPKSNSSNPWSAWNNSNPSGYKKFTPSNNGLEAFKKWLGPKAYKQFVNNLCQSISNQIKQDQKQADLAARKLKAAQEGRDPGSVTE